MDKFGDKFRRKFNIISLVAVPVLLAASSVAVRAEMVEGTIRQIDERGNMLRLSDGKNYKLPGEFDYGLLSEGMKVVVFYDVAGGERYISDIEPEGMEFGEETELEP